MPFWNFRDELSVGDGLVLKGQHIMLPKSLHAAALEQIHYAHQGAEKCMLRAKAAVFWCGINHDVDEMVKSCAPCQAHQVANTKETLIPHDVPKRTCLAHSSYRPIPLEWYGISANCRLLQHVSDRTNTEKH